jgi:hypothetical protein
MTSYRSVNARDFQEKGPTAMINAHIDRQRNKTIDGVTFTNTHSGQKRAYGDSFYEYDVESGLSPDEVERVCRERIHEAIPEAEWLADYRQPGCSMDKAFRSHYKFEKRGDGKYFYQVRFLYTD